MLSGGDKPTAGSVFKRTQARYRRRPDSPDRDNDLDEMIDFHRAAALLADERIISIEVPSTCDYKGKVYGIKPYPGFLFAPSALSPELQTALALAAVSTYCEGPHNTNIDGVPPKVSEVLNSSSMWENWKREYSDGSVLERKLYRSFRKLTWATLGYHYDWTSRSYQVDAQSPLPKALARLGKLFGRTALRIMEVLSNTEPEATDHDDSFEATACIVNYYNSKSVMGGHRDDLEEAVTKPIVSISMGRRAVFLLGGKTVDSEPVLPIIVRPGDVMMMGGDCRLNFHSMARLLPVTTTALPTTASTTETATNVTTQHQVKFEDVFAGNDESPAACRVLLEGSRGELEALEAFLTHHRININLRQVYNTTASEGTKSETGLESRHCAYALPL